MNEHQGSVEPIPVRLEPEREAELRQYLARIFDSTSTGYSGYPYPEDRDRAILLSEIDALRSELLTLRTQPTAEQVRDQAYADVLEILKAEKALAWPERSNFHVAQRIDFINRLKLEVQIRRDSASAKAGGGL